MIPNLDSVLAAIPEPEALALWSYILGATTFAIKVLIEDGRKSFPNGIWDTLFGACVVSLIWPLVFWILPLDRPIFAMSMYGFVVGSYYTPIDYPVQWGVFALVLVILIIAEMDHRRKWERTGDDVFPYRRKVGM